MTGARYNYEEFRIKAIEIANSEIHRYTIPIFEKDFTRKFQLRGSGVFAKIDDAFYLLTAAHVLSGREVEELYVPGFERTLFPIGGKGWFYINEDPDVAIIRLEIMTATELSFFHNYLLHGQIMVDFPAQRNQDFIAVGYPSLFFKHGGTGGYLEYYTLLLKKASENAYKFHNISAKLSYVLQWGKTETIDGHKVEKVEPYGMSGCGLWLVTIESLGPPIEVTYRLVGLMYGYRRTKYQVLIASKIRSVMELLLRVNQDRVN